MPEKFESDSDYFNELEDTKTAFNSSLDIIQRISKIEYSLTSSILEDRLTDSYRLLLLIYSEIEFKLEENESNEVLMFMKQLRADITTAETKFNNKGKIYLKYPMLREDVKDRILELKLVLNRLKYKTGMGMSDLSDPRYALFNG